MQEDDNNLDTVGKKEEEKQQEKIEKSSNVVEKAEKAKKGKKIIDFVKNSKLVAASIGAIGVVLLIILIIIYLIGAIAFFTTLPGLYTENIKEFGVNIWGTISGFFTGDNITPTVTKEDQIKLAQHIQDMGYDIVGYGFADAKYEIKDEFGGETDSNIDKSEVDGYVNGKIVDINNSIYKNNYLQAYIAQSEAIYALSTWSFSGFFKNLFDIFDPNAKGTKAYSKGMINISATQNNIDGTSPKIGIDRKKQSLVIDTNQVLFFGFGDKFYFDMSNWTARYGKPIELFLSLHLATMMPDLTYEFATADAFNTKVNINLQKVDIDYEITYKEPNGNIIPQEKIEEDIAKMNEIKSVKESISNCYESISEVSGDDELTEAEKNEKIEDLEKTIDELKEKLKQLQDEFDSIFTFAQLEEFEILIEEAKKGAQTYLPRITDVQNHWYYESVDFQYGRANRALKKSEYEITDPNNALYNLSGQIILDQTFTAPGGVYYQLCEPDANGPNDAIVALFKGGSGTFNGVEYDFSGEYYRYDGSRLTALKIANALAYKEKGEGSIFTFQNENYIVSNPNNEEWKVEKQPVTFETTDEDGNSSYGDAFAAFAILENTHTYEAECVYRNLRDLLIELEYFTKDDFTRPLTQVLMWPISTEGIDEEELNKGILKDVNEYGLYLKNGETFQTGESVLAPGDATVESVTSNSITIKFKTISNELASILQEKFGSDYKEVQKDILLDMQMTITGINPSVSAGQTISVGSNIGTTTSEDMRIILFDIDKSIVDNIEDYMYPTYDATIEDTFGQG